MAKKTEQGFEKIMMIPLRKSWRGVPRNERGRKAASELRLFLSRHARAEKIKISPRLNDSLWVRGAQKPPSKIKVKTNLDGDTLTARLPEEIVIKKEEKGKGLKDRIKGVGERAQVKPPAAPEVKTEEKKERKETPKEKAKEVKPEEVKAAEKKEEKPVGDVKEVVKTEKKEGVKKEPSAPSKEEVKNVLDKLKAHKDSKTETK